MAESLGIHLSLPPVTSSLASSFVQQGVRVDNLWSLQVQWLCLCAAPYTIRQNGMHDEIYGVMCKITAATRHTLLCLIDKARTGHNFAFSLNLLSCLLMMLITFFCFFFFSKKTHVCAV